MKTKKIMTGSFILWVLITGLLTVVISACGGLNANSSQSGSALGKWSWISGSSSPNQNGNYGTMGIASESNFPGSRDGSISWTDKQGNLWLFGGDKGRSSAVLLNDLWKFDGKNWTWMSGDSVPGKRGEYGTIGVASPASKPGARCKSISWYDKEGNLWLFGGYGYGSKGFLGTLNDLWKFDGKNWTWVSGDDKTDRRGIYGTKGVTDASNKPGARYGSVSWTDEESNLWLFGGLGYSATGLKGFLNDLWKFDGENWTWMSGDFRQSEPGYYGKKGVTSDRNIPGPRHDAVSWIDSKGYLWLFGGRGYNEVRAPGSLNDLWKFDGKNWTWISGDKSENRNADYGTKGIANKSNKPGGRYSCVSWIDSDDNLWLFGGAGYTEVRTSQLNDLWKFDGEKWTWVAGDRRFPADVYGTKGVGSQGNNPGPRLSSISWSDNDGNLWLFGGLQKRSDYLNDLWKFKF
jgi:N-acetylneuraminic acid mutarotase